MILPHIKTLIIITLTSNGLTAQIPNNSSQAIVGITSGWNSSHVSLSIYQKKNHVWQRVGLPWKGRLGKNGLAWGRGIHRQTRTTSRQKVEGDARTPAGIFMLGGVYGYASDIKRHPKLPYRKITPRDLWIEDHTSRYYNQHLILDHTPTTNWEIKGQMRQNDNAHSLKLYIAHNDSILGGQPSPGYGSAIFFHIWRGGGTKPTAGCTTMQKIKLQQLIATIDPTMTPVYVVLPQAEYSALRTPWKLP